MVGHGLIREKPEKDSFGWLVMSPTRENWVYCSLCIVVVLGIVFWFINPIFAILAVIIALLSIGIINVYRTIDYEDPPEPPMQDTTKPEEELQPQVTGIPEKQEPVLEPVKDQEPSLLDVDLTLTKLEPESVQETEDSTSELHQRIAELEQRVKSLNEQLARDPRSSDTIDFLGTKEENGEMESSDETLSEKAIQHLLESLDEKLAKRSISKQLYSKLRDKYIARMEKAKRRHGSAKRGTKTPV